MILNQIYYNTLWNNYLSVNLLPNDLKSNLCILSMRILLDCIKKKKPIHLNIQNHTNFIDVIGEHLFIELANKIYCESAELPELVYGDLLKSRNKRFKKKSIFMFLEKKNTDYILSDKDDNSIITVSEDTFIDDFIHISQKVHAKTLNKFFNFFTKINNKKVYFFNPTNFSQKSIFIGPKTFYDSLKIKNEIPTTYFPSPRDESISHEIKSIPALPDSIMYYVSKYNVCYEKILTKDKIIDTIVVYDTEETEVEQIIQDKNRFGFNLIVLSNKTEIIKSQQIPCWDWYKEETELVNSL